jgi:mannose-1-phosphate guanylyltransferase
MSTIDNTITDLNDKELFNKIPEELKEQKYLEVGVRPWGAYYVLEDKPNFKVKKIIVNPDQRLSLQSHQHRSEHWITVSGTATVEIHKSNNPSEWEFNMPPNQSCFIPMNAKHRLSNKGKIPLVIIEVQVGEYTGEDDIERFEDDYKRVK